ncbi:MAG: hypothetical protein JO289_05855 [Xanthobacteraceae bacterium]|nr:hypothetical protein [Xanthobacteraceae bacterium]MBV9627256.1 hypothetical protein [Xanthobacteraceae bacterium]
MSIANATYTRSTSLAASEARNYPRFFLETVRDNHSSRHHGREIFREEERVEIIMPGNPYTRPIMRVTEEHRQTWPKQYEAFKAGQEIAAEGTPLEAWARMRPKQLHELKALGFRTVEHIANMDDQAAGRVGAGGQDLRQVAQAFLNDAARMAAVERLAAENDAKNAEIEDLRLKLHGLEQTIERVAASKEPAAAPPVLASSLDEFAKPAANAAKNS